MQISWECQAELFKIDAQGADDIRMNFRIFRTCLEDKRKFCQDIAPGYGRAKACLEEHRNDSGFDADCKCVSYMPWFGNLNAHSSQSSRACVCNDVSTLQVTRS